MCVRVCVCVVVSVPRYNAFWDSSGSFVCAESGQRGRPKILYDSLVLLGAFKKIINKSLWGHHVLHLVLATHVPMSPHYPIYCPLSLLFQRERVLRSGTLLHIIRLIGHLMQCNILSPSQNISISSCTRFIAFSMYLDKYLSRYIRDAMNLDI